MNSQNWPTAAPGSSEPVYDNRAESPVELLNETKEFLERFIAYPDPASAVAHTLWIVHAHLIEAFENTPRLAFLSPEPGSGKSRAMELTDALVPNPVLSVNASPAYIFRKISDEAGKPTLLIDEADAIFSTRKADGNEDLRGLLNSGYRKGATAGRATKEGKTEEWPSFCAVALAGLNDLPATLMTRSVIVPMKRRRADQKVEAYRVRIYQPQTNDLRQRLADYADTIRDRVGASFPTLPESIKDRDADLWEPLIAIADEVGGGWKTKAREAGIHFVAQSKNKPVSFGIRLLSDIKKVLKEDRLSSVELVERLIALDASPWASIKGEPLEPRKLARELSKYDIEPQTIRFGDTPLKGYKKSDFVDPWARYLAAETLCSKCGNPLHEAVVKDGFSICPTCEPVTGVTGVTLPRDTESAGVESVLL